MGKYHKIEKMLDEELEKISAQGKLGTSSLEIGDKVAHFLKSIKTIEAMEDAEGESYDYPMNDGRSYARGRGSNAKRDSMGRYSSRYGYSRNDGYSRDGGYSGDKHEMMAELEEMKRKIEEMED